MSMGLSGQFTSGTEMILNIRLDEEGGIDSDSLVGRIVIVGIRGRIDEKDAYLDSWLVALIEGVSAVSKGERKTIEMLEEPTSLLFEPLGQGFRIGYGTEVVIVEQTEVFRDLLVLSCNSFLSDVRSAIGSGESELLQRIKSYAIDEEEHVEERPPEDSS